MRSDCDTPKTFVAHNGDLFVRKSTVDYFSAAYYDDELEVCGRIARLGGSSLRFMVEITGAGSMKPCWSRLS